MAFFFSLRLPIGDQNRGAPSRGPSSWTFALTIFKRSSRGLLGALRRGTRQRIHLGELRSRLRKIGASTQESFRPLGGALSWPFFQEPNASVQEPKKLQVWCKVKSLQTMWLCSGCARAPTRRCWASWCRTKSKSSCWFLEAGESARSLARSLFILHFAQRLLAIEHLVRFVRVLRRLLGDLAPR